MSPAVPAIPYSSVEHSNHGAVSSITSHSHGPVTASSHTVETPHSSSSSSATQVHNHGMIPQFAGYSVHEPPVASSPFPRPPNYSNPSAMSSALKSHAQPQPFPSLVPNNLPTYRNTPTPPNNPYLQPSTIQLPNPLAFLNSLSQSPLDTVFPPHIFSGPLPSPGYYSPVVAPASPLLRHRAFNSCIVAVQHIVAILEIRKELKQSVARRGRKGQGHLLLCWL
ncbi:hypothetical protein J6590_057447 [Homalodisca vitripennis]|nr:hypothetical protein J6590_057447 [Homalodisca vitripennis]